ncbi:DNA gyrase subunit A [Vibrio phage vB_VcorM_GR7B]|nr:DNA gyrase subunit A [Vibrio phage vB_VcorM_GR7B]
MAPRKQKNTTGKAARAKQNKEENIINVDLMDFTREQYIDIYAEKTIGDRALADYRDGLMPVERRLLWAAYKLGMTPGGKLIKSARLIGETMGKYHPHGDTSLYGTHVKLTKGMPFSFFAGQGNWGNIKNPKGYAAMRYTETRITPFAYNTFCNREYMAVTEMLPNFDGSSVEPFVLPSLVPNILLNGSYGIAVGVTGWLPSYEYDGVAKLVKKALTGKRVTVNDCVKNLVFKTTNGAIAYQDLDDADVVEELKDFYKTGHGSVYFYPDYTYDEDERTVTIDTFCPMKDVNKVVTKLEDDERVAAVVDDSDINVKTGSDYVAYTIQLKNNVAKKSVAEVADEMADMFGVTQHFKCNVTERYVYRDEEDEDGVPEVRARFEPCTIPSLIEDWVAWRVDLEAKVLEYRRGKAQDKLRELELKHLACLSIDLIADALKRKDTYEFLSKKLSISLDEAKFIGTLRVDSLRKLEGNKLKSDINDTKAVIREIKKLEKDPASVVAKQLTSLDKIMEAAGEAE